MKKILFLLSIIILTVWIVGYFILKLPAAVHLLLFVSILLYIRSLVCISDTRLQKYYRVKK